MLLNEVSRQTGVLVGTLRYHADKLFGRRSGDFTDDEIASIFGELRESTAAWAKVRIDRSEAGQNRSEAGQNRSEAGQNRSDTDNKSIILDAQLIVSIDRLLQFKIPHWKDYDKHMQVLSKLLHEVAKKGAEQYERDLIEAQQLAEEYNQWLDEQLESDYFKRQAIDDVARLR